MTSIEPSSRPTLLKQIELGIHARLEHVGGRVVGEEVEHAAKGLLLLGDGQDATAEGKLPPGGLPGKPGEALTDGLPERGARHRRP